MAWVKMDERLLDLPLQIGADAKVLMAVDLLAGAGAALPAPLATLQPGLGSTPRPPGAPSACYPRRD